MNAMQPYLPICSNVSTTLLLRVFDTSFLFLTAKTIFGAMITAMIIEPIHCVSFSLHQFCLLGLALGRHISAFFHCYNYIYCKAEGSEKAFSSRNKFLKFKNIDQFKRLPKITSFIFLNMSKIANFIFLKLHWQPKRRNVQIREPINESQVQKALRVSKKKRREFSPISIHSIQPLPFQRYRRNAHG